MAYFETVNQGNSGDENWPTQDLADGIPGESTPTVCLQVGGRDSSGILHAFLTDNSGQLHVLVENTPTVEAILQGTPTVAITGSISASFSPTGTQVVFVDNTVVVQGTIDAIASIVNTPQVLIENTPSVLISGTPTVAITGSISASFSPTGTQVVVVENTPQVLIENTPNVIASVTNTPQVLIENTPQVLVENTPNVIASVTNTPQIAGTVALTGQPIAVDGTVAVIGSLIVTATVSGTCSVLSSNAVVATAIPSLSAGQRVPLTVDVAGACRVNPYNTGAVSGETATGTASNGTVLKITVPAGQKYLVQGLYVTLNCTTNTATRLMLFYYYDNNGNPIMENVAGANQPGNTEATYSGAPGLPQATAIVGSNLMMPWPAVLLGPSFSVGAELFSGAGAAKDSMTVEALVIVYED